VLGTAPVTILPTPAVWTPPHHTYGPDPPPAWEGVRRRHVPLQEGRSALAAGVSDLPLEGSGNSVSPGPPSMRVSTPFRGSGIATCPVTAGARKTLTCRTHGAPARHIWKTVHPIATTTPPAGASRLPARSPQDQGRLSRPMPCPTVYFPQCLTTAPPRFGGRRRLPRSPTHVHRPSL